MTQVMFACCAAGLTCLDVNATSTVISGAEDGSVCLCNIDTGKVLGHVSGAVLIAGPTAGFSVCHGICTVSCILVPV